MPDPPKQSFFKGFFGGGVRQLDRDELFGEASSGKAFSSTAQVTTGENMRNMTVFSFFKLKIFLFKSWEVQNFCILRCNPDPLSFILNLNFKDESRSRELFPSSRSLLSLLGDSQNPGIFCSVDFIVNFSLRPTASKARAKQRMPCERRVREETN